MKTSNAMYDTLKLVALIATPVITFLAALISIWNIPQGAELTASLAALDTLIGAVVVILKTNYDKKERAKKNE